MMAILMKLNRERNKTVLIVSHNISILTGYAGRLIAFQRGMIAEDGPMWDVIKRLSDSEDLSYLIPPSVRHALRQNHPESKPDTVEQLSELNEGREWHGCLRHDIDM